MTKTNSTIGCPRCLEGICGLAVHQPQIAMTRPKGQLPRTGQVKAVQEYLLTCGMRTETLKDFWVACDLSSVVARVEGYFGKFIGIEVTTRDAVQSLLMNARTVITHGSDRPELAHAVGVNCELCSVLTEKTKGALTLRKLRDRLSDIIAEKERDGRPERADLPICFRLSLDRGRGEWYIPAETVYGSPIGLPFPEGYLEVFQINGNEGSAIKDFARRARRNSRKGAK